jgi:Mg2+/Co2+ transporter CorC
MKAKREIKNFLRNLFTNSDLSIAEIERQYTAKFASEDADLLGMVWVEVLNEIPDRSGR